MLWFWLLRGLLLPVFNYLVGSAPIGWTVVKKKTGLDTRDKGDDSSGSDGASNVARILKAAGLPEKEVRKWHNIVLTLDALKGIVTILVCWWATSSFVYAVLSSICTIVGHCFPIWLKFKGGKGMSTTLGVMGLAQPVYAVAAFLVWIPIRKRWKKPVVAALIAIAVFLGGELIFGCDPIVRRFISPEECRYLHEYSLFLPVYLVAMHHENIKRLIKKKEKAIDERNQQGVKLDD